MAKERPLFENATFWLSKICVLPYTDEELDAIGCLGFDMNKNKDFAEKYMSALLERRELVEQHKRIPFSELNLQLYQKVLKQPDLQQIPDWIAEPKPEVMKNNNIEPKKIQFVHPYKTKKANILLIEGVKNGKPGIKILPPLYSHLKEGGYTEEIKQIFKG